jgi:protein-disulfide isomerase
MKFATVPLAMIFLLCAQVVLAQSPKRPPASRGNPPAKVISPQPSPTPTKQQETTTPARASLPPTQIVVVNGQTITTADFETDLRQQLDSLEDRISEAKQEILELQINTLLLEIEARKRGITSHRLYETEVSKRIPVPTPAQIKKFMEENRSQFEGVDPAVATPRIEAYLHDQQEANLADDLANRLRKTIPVVMGVDIKTPNLDDAAVVATVAGQPIRAAALKERLKPIIYKLQLSAYEATRTRAEHMVDDLLLLAEANRRQIGPEEIIRKEISDKIQPPSEAEVAKFYAENKSRIGGDLNSVHSQLVSYLENEAKQQLEKDLSDRLRKSAQIQWLITEPAQPIQAISVDDDPSRGDPSAAVTVVEFTDFQCPACAAMQPVLEEVLKAYGAKVRFVVRDFPLAQHENAFKAAEAANAAHAQGRFFEYTALLFKRQNALDVASLKKYATELGLNRARFDAALDQGTYAAEVKHDMDDGEIYGVSSTPTIFINGVMLKTLSAEALREAIDAAAAKPKAGPPPQ